jgi:hypothetical protein
MLEHEGGLDAVFLFLFALGAIAAGFAALSKIWSRWRRSVSVNVVGIALPGPAMAV